MLVTFALIFVATKAGQVCTFDSAATDCEGYSCDGTYCVNYCNEAMDCSDGHYCTSTDLIYGQCVADTGDCTALTGTEHCASGECLISGNRILGVCAECTEGNQVEVCETDICIIEIGAAGGYCSKCTDTDSTNCGEYGNCILPGPGKTDGLCGCNKVECCDERDITFTNNFENQFNNQCKLCICDTSGSRCYAAYDYMHEYKKGYIDTFCGRIGCEFGDYIFDDVIADDTGVCCPRCVKVQCTTNEGCDRGFSCNTETSTCYTACNADGGCTTGYGCKWNGCKAYECTADNAATNCESGVCGLDGDSGSGYCCEKEAEVYLISKDVGFQCKIHYCKQDGGDMYVKDDVYSVSTAGDANDAEYVSYLKKACPDISECERANLVFPTVTAENDNCCPTCKGSCSYVTCEEGKECYEGVCVAICIEGKSRNADGECDSGCSWESVIAGSECEAGKECWQEVCVATCDADETRNAESGECECTTTDKESVNGVCVDKCGDGKSRNADGDCAKECTDGGSECNADGNESCVDGICQVACVSSNAEGVGEVCTGIGDCVNGVCREACDENETRNNDGECACADGKICDDDQTCDSGVCAEMNVKTGGALNYKLFGLFGFIVVMLSWM